MSLRPVILCILDGWGISNSKEYNAIFGANPPTYNFLLKNYPHSKLFASEQFVGLPALQMGNSEVGHMTIGGGKVFYHDLIRINDALKHDVNQVSILRSVLPRNGGSCHIIGLVSDGGVHSHIDHILSLARYYVEQKVPVKFSIITDGRDTLPRSAKIYIKTIEEFCKQNLDAKIVSISGRYYAMDRDKRYDRTEKAYQAIICGDGHKIDKNNFQDFIDSNYKQGIFDEFIEPSVAVGYNGVSDGDLLVFANFRADRMRQIVDAVSSPNFLGFNRSRVVYRDIKILTITEYSESFSNNVSVIFEPEHHQNILTDILEQNNISQLRVAETEKYAHITFFFDAGKEKVTKLEKRILVPSPKVSRYDLQPEMSAYQVTEEIISEFRKKKYEFCLVNYANTDMVGHTGNYEASVQAVKCVDDCLKKLYDLTQSIDGILIITSDHGNVECMFDQKEESNHTAHTTNPVPFIIVDRYLKDARVMDGTLADIAPTILDLFGLDKPREMTGKSLLVR
jgi:2,3-bisphosphoglycerate-independent phosphoglycerate mutase